MIQIITHEATFDDTMTNKFKFNSIEDARQKFIDFVNSDEFEGEVDIILTSGHTVIESIRI